MAHEQSLQLAQNAVFQGKLGHVPWHHSFDPWKNRHGSDIKHSVHRFLESCLGLNLYTELYELYARKIRFHAIKVSGVGIVLNNDSAQEFRRRFGEKSISKHGFVSGVTIKIPRDIGSSISQGSRILEKAHNLDHVVTFAYDPEENVATVRTIKSSPRPSARIGGELLERYHYPVEKTRPVANFLKWIRPLAISFSFLGGTVGLAGHTMGNVIDTWRMGQTARSDDLESAIVNATNTESALCTRNTFHAIIEDRKKTKGAEPLTRGDAFKIQEGCNALSDVYYKQASPMRTCVLEAFRLVGADGRDRPFDYAVDPNMRVLHHIKVCEERDVEEQRAAVSEQWRRRQLDDQTPNL